MKVPGLWRQNSFTEFFFRPKTGGVINTYDGKPLTKYDNAWYERTFDLGSEAKNKTILLRFNRIMAERSGMAGTSAQVRLLSAGRSSQELMDAIRNLKKALEYTQGNVSPAAICGWLEHTLRT